jgi:hypothetical protein
LQFDANKINVLIPLEQYVHYFLCQILQNWIFHHPSFSLWLHSRSSVLQINVTKLETVTSTRNLALSRPVCVDPCLWKAGINGSWVQDFEFAENYGQYLTPWVIPPGPYFRRTAGAFIPSEDAPFPWRTSWKWVDHECSVDVMTYDGICRIMEGLNIRHLLFYGDSLTESHYSSFVNKMGLINFDKTKGVLTCRFQADKVPFTIKLFHNRDKGGNAFPHSPRGVYRLENDTQIFIENARADRLLGVFNIGVHYHNWTHYTENIDTMIQLLNKVNRTQDIYFFRATSPGHQGCQPRSRNFDWKRGTRLRPLTSYSEYNAGTTYDWNKFEEYNNYTKHLLLQRNRMGIQPVMHYMDIWNMTALRHDAHAAPSDCLHFHSPGPVDWWNHLLYTYLNRMVAVDLKDDRGINCRRVEM